MNTQTQNMPTQSPAKAFQVYMNKYKSQLEMALPKHLTVDRMMRLSLTAFSQNPKLQECSSNSIFSSIIIASQLGLEPGVNGQGYLVPYQGICTFIPGWKGLVDLAQRGGRSSVWTGAVYEGDEFDYMLGDAPYCRHKPCGEFDNDKLTHVYAIGRVKDSEMPIIEVWPVKKVRAHFTKTVVKSLQPKHYSHKHFEAYARKVALLQVLKYMPQSIELSNAMDVSSAAEQGKNVTIDGDFVTVDNNQREDLQDQNTENTAQQDVYQNHQQIAQNTERHEQDEADYALTFAQIKRGILTAKSSVHLEILEEQAMDHSDKNERKQLMSLIKAQAQKFEESTTKKSKTPVEETPPAVEPKKPRRTQTQPRIVKNEEKEIHHIIDPEKSLITKNGLLGQIVNAKSVDELEQVAVKINESKPKLSNDDVLEILNDYAARAKLLEDQLEMFAGVDETTFFDRAILQIRNAKSQDDINDVYANPDFDELSDLQQEQLDKEAQQRESELQD